MIGHTYGEILSGRVKNCPLKEVSDNSVLGDIKSELLENLRDIDSNTTEFSGSAPIRFFNKGINKAISIVDNYISGKE